MRFGSVCSGIEAASVAFSPLGWKAAWFAEIEAFPSAVLAHHYSEVPNHGDMTTIAEKILAGEVEAPNLICGGTPCQAFSVAGLRNSLDDDRGNLTLQFIKICNANDTVRRAAGRAESWILYENVPGLLSTHDNAFGAFLGGLCGCYAAIPQPAGGWTSAGVVDGPQRVVAWRVLDAQHFGLAQRRKRVFVLARGGAGRWSVADALLPIIESSSWHLAPSRGKGKGVAAAITAGAPNGGPAHGARSGSAKEGNLIPEVTRPLTAAMGTKWNGNGDLESSLIPEVVGALATNTGPNGNDAGNFQCNQAVDAGYLIAHTLKGEGFDASEDGTGRGVPLVMAHGQANAEIVSDGSPSLTCNHEPPILVRMREGKEGGGKGPLVSEDQSLTLATANDQVAFLHVNKGRPDGRESKHTEMVTVETESIPTITTNGHQNSAVIAPGNSNNDTLQPTGINHASTYEADASSVLSTLLEKVGSEAFTQWGLGILSAFQSPEVLRSWLHGESLRGSTEETRPEIIGGSPSSEESAAGEVLRKVWFDGPDGRTSQGRGLAKQLAGKPGEALSVLPHEGAPDEGRMHSVRTAREGARLLREALSEIQETRRPAVGEGQPARAYMQVRRLVPEECEALQGFPRGYTLIPYRGKPAKDGPRYKALGNSWAVPVVRWIGERIHQVEAVAKSKEHIA